MSIKVRSLMEAGAGLEAKVIIIDSAESWLAFQQLIQNGSGLFPNQSAEIKAFSDIVRVGRVLQNYANEIPSSIKSNPNSFSSFHPLKD